MNITLTIEAPELVGALEGLALALSGAGMALPVAIPADITSEDVAVSNAKAEKEAADKVKAEKATALKVAADKAKKEADEKAAQLAAKEATVYEDAKEDKPEAQTISLDVVRGKLAELAAQGKPQQGLIQDAINRFGVKKLTDVDATDYVELLELCGVTA